MIYMIDLALFWMPYITHHNHWIVLITFKYNISVWKRETDFPRKKKMGKCIHFFLFFFFKETQLYLATKHISAVLSSSYFYTVRLRLKFSFLTTSF